MRRRDMIALLGSTLIAPALKPTLALSANRSSGMRLVLVELAGANDGLNTLVPWRNDDYRRARPTLALDGQDIIPLDDEVALHSALRPLMEAEQAGELALVQGLGYPRPNRSHFQSIALWERAGDGESGRRRNGWMTHAIEHGLGRRRPDVHGLSVSGGLSLFASEGGRWLSADSVTALIDASHDLSVTTTIDNAIVSRIAARYAALDKTLSHLQEKLAAAPEGEALEGGGLGEQLRVVTQFIGSGLDVPVFRVRLSGFDTHENQRGRHARLMRELAESLASFRERLIAMNEWQSTLVMSYSEFGRRVAENASGGTDHGSAAPHLLLGGRVRGGRHGDAPNLDATTLDDGDPAFTMDYRALYARVIDDGLGAIDRDLSAYHDDRLSGLIV